MNFYVYVLFSLRRGIHYVGSTGNIEKRIDEHNLGFSQYTKSRGPWKLVYKEDFNSRAEAMRREKFFKSGKGRSLLKEILSSCSLER